MLQEISYLFLDKMEIFELFRFYVSAENEL